MKYFKGFWMALGMFCGIPLPFHIWDEKHTSVMVASLPLVGGIIGFLWWLAGTALIYAEAPLVMSAAILTVVPFLITGFIHLDGYMDTSDAILSYRPAPEKLRILKDPNVGAFAVIMLAILLILQFAAVFTVTEQGTNLALLIAIPVISRGCAAFSVYAVRHIPESNYTAMLAQNVKTTHKIFTAAIIITAVTAAVLYAGITGLIAGLAVVICFAAAMANAYRHFKGIAGDMIGYSLVIGELGGLIAWVLF